MPENIYKQILAEHDNMERPDEVYASAIQFGVSEHMAAYMKEFVTRISRTSGLTYEDAMTYADLFITNVANQTSFTATEKYNMVAIVSIYKNSLTYWNYAIENK